MPTVEVDHAAVVRVVLGYLRDLNCIRAMRCLEEETGLVQGEYGKVRRACAPGLALVVISASVLHARARSGALASPCPSMRGHSTMCC